MKKPSSLSAPRSSKSLHAFDLSSILDQLPPNTGPPGTVRINGSSGSLNTSNKNLSHVPCKFFRQGVCQAGNSCPFSHNLDGTLAADKLPCKYFQKGNCKFGLKCALAHFLPDGTRVNSKGLSYRRGNDRSDRSDRLDRASYFSQFHTSGSPSNGGNINISGGSRPSSASVYSSPSSYTSLSTPADNSQPIDISANALSPSRNNIVPPAQFRLPSQFANSQTSGGYRNFSGPASMSASANGSNGGPNGPTRRHSGTAAMSASLSSSAFSYNGADWSNGASLLTPTNGTSFSGSLSAQFTNGSPPGFPMSSPGSERTSANTTLYSPQAQHAPLSYSKPFPQTSVSSSPQYNYNGSLNESAIADDESEENFDNDDSALFEDFVPASLGSLILTPQERQRRNSRSQSGTLLVRPNLLLTPLDKRFDKLVKLRHSDNDVFLME